MEPAATAVGRPGSCSPSPSSPPSCLPPLSLTDLPPELLALILEALPGADLARVQAVSADLRAAASDSALWRRLVLRRWHVDRPPVPAGGVRCRGGATRKGGGGGGGGRRQVGELGAVPPLPAGAGVPGLSATTGYQALYENWRALRRMPASSFSGHRWPAFARPPRPAGGRRRGVGGGRGGAEDSDHCGGGSDGAPAATSTAAGRRGCNACAVDVSVWVTLAPADDCRLSVASGGGGDPAAVAAAWAFGSVGSGGGSGGGGGGGSPVASATTTTPVARALCLRVVVQSHGVAPVRLHLRRLSLITLGGATLSPRRLRPERPPAAVGGGGGGGGGGSPQTLWTGCASRLSGVPLTAAAKATTAAAVTNSPSFVRVGQLAQPPPPPPPPPPPATWNILGVCVLALLPASGGAHPPLPATVTATAPTSTATATPATLGVAPDDGDGSDGEDDADDAGAGVTLAESDAAVLSVTVPAPAEAVWEPDVLERLALAVVPVSPLPPAGGALAATTAGGECGCGNGDGPAARRQRRRAVRVAFEEATVWQYYQPISGAGYVFREKAGSL